MTSLFRKSKISRSITTNQSVKFSFLLILVKTDPYLNLSIEEYLFRNESKSVIIGRNQNPWQETNLEELKQQDIRIVRRRSGGGTVYHVSKHQTSQTIKKKRGVDLIYM
ncbi:hypothetical protein PSHT_01359 [Puccinia striiformis]|uniref:Putative lipoate-protein ligase A n=1 Tax=Puccinia striiformis TaxID=27350 RepID=A0A2S4WKX6_9BASI|nr:hypothetical protein PSHT_01359 [Puccinia striiformis]